MLSLGDVRLSNVDEDGHADSVTRVRITSIYRLRCSIQTRGRTVRSRLLLLLLLFPRTKFVPRSFVA